MKQQEFQDMVNLLITNSRIRFLIIGKGAILYLMHERGISKVAPKFDGHMLAEILSPKPIKHYTIISNTAR